MQECVNTYAIMTFLYVCSAINFNRIRFSKSEYEPLVISRFSYEEQCSKRAKKTTYFTLKMSTWRKNIKNKDSHLPPSKCKGRDNRVYQLSQICREPVRQFVSDKFWDNWRMEKKNQQWKFGHPPALTVPNHVWSITVYNFQRYSYCNY